MSEPMWVVIFNMLLFGILGGIFFGELGHWLSSKKYWLVYFVSIGTIAYVSAFMGENSDPIDFINVNSMGGTVLIAAVTAGFWSRLPKTAKKDNQADKQEANPQSPAA